jgi:hypothetical protein
MLTPKQRDVLTALVEAERGTIYYRREIGNLQSGAIVVGDEEIPRSSSAFFALLQAGLIGIHRDDRGLGAPPYQRLYTTAEGREEVAR